jgi:hypothetical protein
MKGIDLIMKKRNEELINNKKGITLVALVVSIVVLIILAGVSISMLTGENGLIRQATKAKEETEIATWNEQKQLIVLGALNNQTTDMVSYLTQEFQQIDSSASVTDVGNCYYIKCNNQKFIYDYDLKEYEVNEGDSNFWKYIENDDGTLTITGYKYNPSGEIIIPNFIDDKKVKIVSCSFKDNTDLTSMKISYGIEELSGGLFANCTNLSGDINLPSSLKKIGYGCFSRCIGLTGDLNLENVNFVKSHAFSYCNGLNGKLYVNSNGAIVGYMAFYNCTQLNGKAIVSGFASDADMSFFSCENLEEVEFVYDLDNIAPRSFGNCSKLKTIIIPESVTTIGSCAFYQCTNLTSITMSSNIESIDRLAFGYCKNLEGTIKLSSNCIIGENAFAGCNKLTIQYID